MRIVVAYGTVHLGVDLDALDGFNDAGETNGNVRKFLADRRRRCRLTVRAGEHGDGGPLVRKACDRCVNLFEVGDKLFTAALEHDRVARVVDVFRGAGKVNEFGGALQFFIVRNLSLDPVFDGLHVVVRRLFNFLDGFAVGEREIVGETAQESFAVVTQVRELVKAGFREADEPFDFDANAGVHEGAFGENVAKHIGLAGIAAVNRRERGQGIEFHGGNNLVR